MTSATSVDPVQDFHTLLAKGVPLESLSNQMEKVVFSLLRASTGGQMVEKIVGCLKAYRQASLDLKRPLAFNEFVKEIRDTLLDRREIWRQVKVKELGPISRDVVESSKAKYDPMRAGVHCHSVDGNYDLMNDPMNAGVHRHWKDTFMSILNPHRNLLDVVTPGKTNILVKRQYS